ncbi:uncharacterized protein LOC126840579 [Adelges cooleyi]|uniref:uncharacterized protein LOC126840579 n=1 Tax=Adelges cooleyi TaxID=133065 RepID=UPI00217FF196|nr:uncharacterized protein LOC126840579 [Adelges cooleyi]
MELEKRYTINILCQLKNGYFIVVEKFCNNASPYFMQYHKELLTFNDEDCDEWFLNMNFPQIETGKAIISKKKNHNKWVRSIISNPNGPELYLIDTQRLTDCREELELRVCHPKFLQLKLPTYYIDLDLCNNNDRIRTMINMLINKNQHGEISFGFVPHSIDDNIYKGELFVYEENNKSFIPFKKMYKSFYSKSNSKDNLKIFDPMQYAHMVPIFAPRDHNTTDVFEGNLVSSYFDIYNINLSDNSSFNRLIPKQFLNEYNYKDDSEKFHETDDLIPIAKQKVYSSSNYSSNSTEHQSAVSSTSSSSSQIMKSPHSSDNLNRNASSSANFIGIESAISNIDTSKKELSNITTNSSSSSLASNYSRCSMHSLVRDSRRRKFQENSKNLPVPQELEEKLKQLSINDEFNVWWSSDEE